MDWIVTISNYPCKGSPHQTTEAFESEHRVFFQFGIPNTAYEVMTSPLMSITVLKHAAEFGHDQVIS